MIFYRKREVNDLKLTLNNREIQRVEQCGFLGLQLDSRLQWSAHVDYVAGRLTSAYYAIVNLKSFMDPKQLLNIYYALAHSHLSYLLLYWGQTTELQRLFIIQKRIIRKIFFLNPLQSCRETFQQHKILTLPNALIFSAVIFVKKNISRFPNASSVHKCNTRNANKIYTGCCIVERDIGNPM